MFNIRTPKLIKILLKYQHNKDKKHNGRPPKPKSSKLKSDDYYWCDYHKWVHKANALIKNTSLQKDGHGGVRQVKLKRSIPFCPKCGTKLRIRKNILISTKNKYIELTVQQPQPQHR